MRKLVIASVIAATAGTAVLAGGVEEPTMAPVEVEKRTSSSAGGILIPLLILILVAAAASSSGGGGGTVEGG